jgi:hypothetical protein
MKRDIWSWLHVAATAVLVVYGFVTTATLSSMDEQLRYAHWKADTLCRFIVLEFIQAPVADDFPCPLLPQPSRDRMGLPPLRLPAPRTDGRDVEAPFNLDRTI